MTLRHIEPAESRVSLKTVRTFIQAKDEISLLLNAREISLGIGPIKDFDAARGRKDRFNVTLFYKNNRIKSTSINRVRAKYDVHIRRSTISDEGLDAITPLIVGGMSSRSLCNYLERRNSRLTDPNTLLTIMLDVRQSSLVDTPIPN